MLKEDPIGKYLIGIDAATKIALSAEDGEEAKFRWFLRSKRRINMGENDGMVLEHNVKQIKRRGWH